MIIDSSPPRQQPSAVLADELRQAHRSAGCPSLRTLSQRIDRDYRYSVSPATISRMLSGRNKPTWDNTKHFLLACGVTSPEDLTTWHRRWSQLDVPPPVPQAVTPTTDTAHEHPGVCRHCGVADSEAAQRAAVNAREQLLLELLDRATRERDDALQRLRVLEGQVPPPGPRRRWRGVFQAATG